MRFKLIQMTQNPIDVMWVAARTCYSEKSPIDIWDSIDAYVGQYTAYPYGVENVDGKLIALEDNKRWNLVKKVLDSGHQSIAEHVYFTFAIEGISRSCSHQLVRHRAGIVFSQQSQRYVEIKEDVSDILRWEEAKPLLDKYFVNVNTSNWQEYLDCLKHYLHHIEMGMRAEDARNVLPNATKTNITMSINFRELIHICNLRLCTRAQLEIRQLFQAIKEEVNKYEPKLASLLVPSCEVTGFCREGKCCGRKPSVKEISELYKLLQTDETVLSNEDWKQLMGSINNPQVNKKLQKFMKENIVI